MAKDKFFLLENRKQILDETDIRAQYPPCIFKTLLFEWIGCICCSRKMMLPMVIALNAYPENRYPDICQFEFGHV